MSLESRRSTIRKLIISEGIAGRPIEDDADFLSLAERWIHREIDMKEMRRLYQGVRDERRRRKWGGADSASAVSPSVKEPPSSTNDLLPEIARITQAIEER
ncbi:hypothetical protein [Pararhizobium qamdonense]|uniref:hypothetical protein n=1 Tax=Pararhizobium qamdonense TaxID=3031126 RepID=UPI0023E17335|nr:hypothetical protein [Pararhizobium qamdonense]